MTGDDGPLSTINLFACEHSGAVDPDFGHAPSPVKCLEARMDTGFYRKIFQPTPPWLARGMSPRADRRRKILRQGWERWNAPGGACGCRRGRARTPERASTSIALRRRHPDSFHSVALAFVTLRRSSCSRVVFARCAWIRVRADVAGLDTAVARSCGDRRAAWSGRASCQLLANITPTVLPDTGAETSPIAPRIPECLPRRHRNLVDRRRHETAAARTR